MYADGYIKKEKFRRDMDISRNTNVRIGVGASGGWTRRNRQREELRLVMGRIEEFAEQVRDGLGDQRRATRRRIICALVKEVESMPRRSILCIV